MPRPLNVVIGGNYHAGLHCCCCGDALKTHSVFFELLDVFQNPCHVVCPVCCCHAQATRGCSPTFRCPEEKCNHLIIGHVCVRWDSSRNPLVGDAVMITKPNPDMDAHRLFSLEPLSIQRKKVVLSASFLRY